MKIDHIFVAISFLIVLPFAVARLYQILQEHKEAGRPLREARAEAKRHYDDEYAAQQKTRRDGRV